MKTINCQIESTLASDKSWDELKIDGFDNGIKIDARNIKSGEDSFSFELIVGYQLPMEAGKSFKNIINGMVLTLESPNTGDSGVIRLGDPDVKPEIPNFTGDPISKEPATSCFGERFGLQLTTRIKSDERNLLYLRVFMQSLFSNSLLIKPSTGDVINYG
jgi:hypothetical protein